MVGWVTGMLVRFGFCSKATEFRPEPPSSVVVPLTVAVWVMGMAALYNLLSGHLLKDLLIAPRLLLKGKLPLIPSRAGRKGMKELFERVREAEAEERRRIDALEVKGLGSGSGRPEPC